MVSKQPVGFICWRDQQMLMMETTLQQTELQVMETLHHHLDTAWTRLDRRLKEEPLLALRTFPSLAELEQLSCHHHRKKQEVSR